MYKEIKYNIYSKKIEKDINILHISDIHFYKNSDIKLLDKLYDKFSENKFNYIIFTGDILDENKTVSNKLIYLKEWIEKLSKLATVIIGFGNHDMYSKEKGTYINDFNGLFWRDINKIDNVYVLYNNAYEDDNIYVYGHISSLYYYCPKENKNVLLEELDNINKSNNKYNILLLHSPFYLNDKDISSKLIGYDLILSGHMHNGLMPPILDEIFNNTRGIITRDKELFSKMCRGYYIDKYISIISSGINKLHSRKIYIINLLNIFYPRGFNTIKISNKRCKFTISHNYSK